jgi:hypothetical protein
MKISKHLIPAMMMALLAAPFAFDVAAQTGARADSVPVKQSSFASPEEAAKALADAVRAGSVDKLLAVVGPGSAPWLFSGDKVGDANDWKKFLASYDEKNTLEKQGDSKAILSVGKDDWPFPAPIVKKGTHWRFDTEAGREEIINRRVGQNELDTIQTLLAIVDAQREYAMSDSDGNGSHDYARRFLSSKGKKDGLFWPDETGKPQSPLGPLVAGAASEGYARQPSAGPKNRDAYHGYLFRILTAQGKDANGGAHNYLVGDHLMGGFAIVAYPATYGSSGVMTFIVNYQGVVYEKDLGAHSAAAAPAMKEFNPDSSWKKVQQ